MPGQVPDQDTVRGVLGEEVKDAEFVRLLDPRRREKQGPARLAGQGDRLAILADIGEVDVVIESLVCQEMSELRGLRLRTRRTGWVAPLSEPTPEAASRLRSSTSAESSPDPPRRRSRPGGIEPFDQLPPQFGEEAQRNHRPPSISTATDRSS